MNSGFAGLTGPIPGNTLTDQLAGRRRTSLPVRSSGALTGRGGICAARATRL